MLFLQYYNFSRLGCLLALILALPLAACSSGGSDSSGGGGGSGSTGQNTTALTWVAPSEREDGSGLNLSDITGFRVYYGPNPGEYSNTIVINDHTATQAALDNLPSGTYYVVVTTVDSDGRESVFSSEVVVTL